ncbi:16S rRNA (guanine(527)-N(7))-methyltransferase RsmG [Sulfitobacter sp. F26204]|uniref:16S rRNA (guanine(527)-N(7))-methyltransferase RsmG n=1 Tax=Sulfitobacter sp. F26204 TaxID=2996014 RepID=UPI00225E5718|nr:16S rRNA (guanine(527)-N(7))-methyltransferase RsmG [Sulfitobacter sp. F26204]MCX7558250.1 16S rRNA (guanine(527)-N(7))-methyltransferase RsmG [Sulfitobacter sp. F26204]
MMKRDGLNVSRETLQELEAFAMLVEKWTAKINLVSKQSLADLWDRHILDSAQLFELAPQAGHWVDLGSGGGFPAIVVALLSKGAGADQQFTLVESDQRKATFLRTAIRELGLRATVISERIEKVEPLAADVLTARALAGLSTLCDFADRHLDPEGVALFLKGGQWQQEDKSAREMWSYSCEAVKSKSHPDAAILKIKDIARV